MDKRSVGLKLKDSKYKRLGSILRALGKVVVAYSGGLDSTFLLKAALDTLGRKNVIAVTARSETYPHSEYREALEIVNKLGARHITIRTDELNIKNFKSNPVNRCYYCKKELFGELGRIRDRYKMNYVIDGTNLDDLKDIRHGAKAAAELGVRRPLLEAGIGKDDIRRYSKKMKLETWDKPSFACLASRFPFNTAITSAGLKRIELAEDYLRQLGFKQARARFHNNIVRLEFSRKDFNLALKLRDSIVKKLKRTGFTYVTLDLEGYRTGSMHEGVGIDKKMRGV